MEFDLKLLSRYRTQLMGVAILFIMLCHTPIPTEYPLTIKILRKYGYWGVDIFMLLSGLGIFFAYQKENTLIFLKKRFLRILPYYLPIAFIFSVFFIYLGKETFWNNLLPDITFFSFWSGKQIFGWYIPAILFFYLITPLLFRFKRFKWIIVIIYILVCILTYTITNHFAILLYRLPIFVMGLYIGYLITKGKKINIKWLIASTILGTILLICNYTLESKFEFIAIHLHYTPFFFLVIPTCLFLAKAFSKLKNYSYPILTFLGTYTLTLYTFHERILMSLYFIFSKSLNITAFVLTLILAYLWQNLVSYILKKYKFI